MVRPRSVRVVLWLSLAASLLAALWCANLFIFHGWASHVPPYETAMHLTRARQSAGAGLAFLAAAGLLAWRLNK